VEDITILHIQESGILPQSRRVLTQLGGKLFLATAKTRALRKKYSHPLLHIAIPSRYIYSPTGLSFDFKASCDPAVAYSNLT
jgi:hypothetical protein